MVTVKARNIHDSTYVLLRLSYISISAMSTPCQGSQQGERSGVKTCLDMHLDKFKSASRVYLTPFYEIQPSTHADLHYFTILIYGDAEIFKR